MVMIANLYPNFIPLFMQKEELTAEQRRRFAALYRSTSSGNGDNTVLDIDHDVEDY